MKTKAHTIAKRMSKIMPTKMSFLRFGSGGRGSGESAIVVIPENTTLDLDTKKMHEHKKIPRKKDLQDKKIS